MPLRFGRYTAHLLLPLLLTACGDNHALPDDTMTASDQRTAEHHTPPRPPTWRLLVSAIGLLLAVTFAAYTLWNLGSGGSASHGIQPFDRAAWLRHSDPDEDRNPRMSMVGDVKQRLLAGSHSRSDVIDLLGEPTWERGGALYYCVGWWETIDPHSLVVKFTGDDMVRAVVVHQH
jgi:hypothetical protein